jgi:hypothetical protein
MTKSIAGIPKKRGRPATGRDPQIAIRFPAYIIEQVDGWAAKNSLSRSEAIRQFVERGLAATGPKPKAKR